MRHEFLMRHTLAFLLLGATATGFAREEKSFNYAGEDVRQWGTAKLENYDVAIRIADPTLAGNKITRIDVPGVAEEGLSDYSLWMSSELRLEGKKNTPDILSANVEPINGTLSITLDEPYTIPADGVFIGYSFTMESLTEAAKAPISVADSQNPDAFFIHTSRSYMSWGNYNLGLAADITVTLEGAFHSDAVAVTSSPEPGSLPGAAFSMTLNIRNHGNRPVENITYQLTADGRTISNTLYFSPPLPCAYDSDVAIEVDFEPIDKAGAYPWTFTVTEVNGVPNADTDANMAGMAYIYPYLPKHRPLMEEYTGTWCGWCPRGAIGMKLLRERFGEDFAGVAFHKDDIMAIDFTMPMDYPGAPSCLLDRAIVADPYYGTSPESSRGKSFIDGIGADWERIRNFAATADLSAEAAWTDENMEEVEVKVSAKFVREYHDVDFRFIYILTADGLSGSGHAWQQKNYYSGDGSQRDTDLAPLVDLPEYIDGFEFDDVAVAVSDMLGIEGSLPADIRCLEPLEGVYRFKIADAVNTSGNSMIQDKNRLRATAAVVDASSGRIINSIQVPVKGISGVKLNTGNKTVTEEIYFDLQGRRIAKPGAGLYILRRHYSDGSTATIKTIIK